MPDVGETPIKFNVSVAPESSSAMLYLVVLHQLSGRPSLRDLERVLRRIALRKSERLSIVLEVTHTCPRAVTKAAARLCARHAVHYYSVDRPVAAAAHALAEYKLQPCDFVTVIRDVLPDEENFIDRILQATEGSALVNLFRLAPPSVVAFAASAGLLQIFCTESQIYARHEDADILLQCFFVGSNNVSSPLGILTGVEKESFLVTPLRNYITQVTEKDIEMLDSVMLRLGIKVAPQNLQSLQSTAAAARALLRRAVAAHWRVESGESESIHQILYAPYTGIVSFCRRMGVSVNPSCIPGLLCSLGIRDMAEELGVHANGNDAFRCAMLEAFPAFRARLQVMSHSLASSIADIGLAW